jgi:hypothetical protein
MQHPATLKINFFTQSSSRHLARTLELINSDKFSVVARKHFGRVVEISYDDTRNIALVSDSKLSLVANGEGLLDLFVQVGGLVGALSSVLDYCLKTKPELCRELWDGYAKYLELGDKVRLLKHLRGYVTSSSFRVYGPEPYIMAKQDFSNMLIFANVYDDTILTQTSFKNSHITNSSFKRAFIGGVDFSDCVLEQVDFSDAIVDDQTNFAGAYLVDTILPKWVDTHSNL